MIKNWAEELNGATKSQTQLSERARAHTHTHTEKTFFKQEHPNDQQVHEKNV